MLSTWKIAPAGGRLHRRHKLMVAGDGDLLAKSQQAGLPDGVLNTVTAWARTKA
jgi:hypothetical protein